MAVKDDAIRDLAVHQPLAAESDEIQELYRLFLLERAPALVGPGPGRRHIPIPESVYDVLLKVINYMSQGKGVSVVPVMEELTTQRAANMLGVSRPFLIGLLKEGKIPYHKTGTHRRIFLKDLLDYRKERDKNRRHILNQMAKREAKEGTYDKFYVPDDEEE